MTLIADRFTASARGYDEAARIQPLVAARLAARLPIKASRVLEIGCGTGGLSTHLVRLFPDAEMILSDISPAMLELCRQAVGDRPSYRLIDAENLPSDLGCFDLIVSSLALQWVRDLQATLQSFIDLLNPGGCLAFAVLGEKNFKEWAALLSQCNAPSGLHHYPSAEAFCWPASYHGRIEEEFIPERHESGAAFLKALKKIGANTPKSGHQPVSSSVMKQVLKASASGLTVSYHVLYGQLTR